MNLMREAAETAAYFALIVAKIFKNSYLKYTQANPIGPHWHPNK
jgi:hypothetical protein